MQTLKHISKAVARVHNRSYSEMSDTLTSGYMGKYQPCTCSRRKTYSEPQPPEKNPTSDLVGFFPGKSQITQPDSQRGRPPGPPRSRSIPPPPAPRHPSSSIASRIGNFRDTQIRLHGGERENEAGRPARHDGRGQSSREDFFFFFSRPGRSKPNHSAENPRVHIFAPYPSGERNG